MIGPFDVEFIPVTHSVPHGFATAFHTPQGVILHSGDFKIDLTPVDGRATDLARIGALADGPGMRLLLSDSTNAEEEGHTESERRVGAVLADLFAAHPDKRIIVACFASHIHRIQQIADAAIANGRIVATLGRSMAKNVALARSMGLLHIPDDRLVDIEQIGDLDPRRVCVISTGSQGRTHVGPGPDGRRRTTSGSRSASGDLVVLSSHAIPGNETNVGKVIDGLTPPGRRGHPLGPGAGARQRTRQAGGAEDAAVAGPPGVLHPGARRVPPPDPSRPAGPGDGRRPRQGAAGRGRRRRRAHRRQGIDFVGEVPAGYLYVDGIVGDVGRGVLRDRRVLAEEGVVVVVVTVDAKSGEVLDRARDHHPRLGVRPGGRGAARRGPPGGAGGPGGGCGLGSVDFETLKRRARSALGRFVQERTRRRPMIVPVVMEV